MTKVYIIRHAESDGNLYRRIHGQYDGLVTDRGLRQIEALSERFKEVPVDAVYSSDLYRTRLTSSALCKPKGLELNLMSGLREVNVGIWEDKCWGEVEDEYPEQLNYFNHSPDKWQVEGSEAYAELQNRMLTSVRRIAAENPGKSVAAFTHGNAIRAMLCAIMQIPPDEVSRVYYCDNTAVTLLNVDEHGGIEIGYMNDNSHLTGSLSAFARETWWKEKEISDHRNLRFRPMNLAAESTIYLKCYKDAWRAAHNTYKGFSNIYLDWARQRSKEDPMLVARAYLKGNPCGIIELSKESELEWNAGHIAFLYLDPPYRGRGLAVQLLGQAVSYYRNAGKGKIRLKVSEDNRRARSFYDKYGFYKVGDERGSLGSLDILEKDISKIETF